MNARKTLLAVLGFGQCLGLSGMTVAQNVFNDDLCSIDQNDPAQCIDNGCAKQGGECQSEQAQLPDGDTQQGCICDQPDQPQGQCQVVNDAQGPGGKICVDLACPPIQEFNCDPVTCECGAPQEFGDELCQPNQDGDPQQCQDLGCSEQNGICLPTQAQNPDGQGVGGCHCEIDDPQGQGQHCEVLIDHQTQLPVCYDLDCGQMADYDCDPQACDCLCEGVIPLPNLTLLFTDKERYEWTGSGTQCSRNYNSYRADYFTLPDVLPPFAVSDDYGFCRYSGLLVEHAMEPLIPASGVTFFILVSAESLAGEAGLGFTSAGALRPNLTPCPTPPPMP